MDPKFWKAIPSSGSSCFGTKIWSGEEPSPTPGLTAISAFHLGEDNPWTPFIPKKNTNPIIIQKARKPENQKKGRGKAESDVIKRIMQKGKKKKMGLTLRASESGEQCDDGSASSSCGGRRRHRGGLRRLPRHTPYLLSLSLTHTTTTTKYHNCLTTALHTARQQTNKERD